jgi:hypothetical protein
MPKITLANAVPKATADRAAYMRERRRIAADAGLCSKCTARKPRKGYSQCKACIDAGKLSMEISRRKKRVRKILGK